MSLTAQQTEYGSTASDSQSELTRRKVRQKSVTAPTTRSQSQKDSNTDEVFGSQTLQRTTGNTDLRTEDASGATTSTPQVQDSAPWRGVLHSPQPPRLSIQPIDRIPTAPGSAQRTRHIPTTGDAEQKRDDATSPAPPQPPPMYAGTPEKQVHDLAEYLAQRMRRDFEAFRHEMQHHVVQVVQEAVIPVCTPDGRASRASTRRPISDNERRDSPRSTPERCREPEIRPTPRRAPRNTKKRHPPREDTSTEEEVKQKAPARPVATARTPATAAAVTSEQPAAGEKPRAMERGIAMPIFKGTNWVAFQIKFATYCGRYGLDDEEKLERLKLALEDTACRVLYSRDPGAWTYSELIKALENRYGHSKSYPMVERELRRIKRKPGQSLQDLADEIREVSRKTFMKEHVRDHLTRSAFMGALDDDTQMIHYIDKRDPTRESLSTALDIAERYERENGSSVADMVTRLDAAQTADAVQTVAAYGTGPSPLVKQVNHNTQILQDVQQTLQTVLQTLKKQNTSSDGSSSSRRDGHTWPGSNYKGKNFIPNFKHPSQRTDDDTSDANNNVNQSQQRQGGGQQRKKGQTKQNQNQSAAAGTSQQQNAGAQAAGGDVGTTPQKQ